MEDFAALEQAKKALRTSEGIAISSTGASGGILTLRDSQIWGEEVTFCANYWILTVLNYKDTSLKFYLINIYMPNRYSDKIECWYSLFAIQESLDMSSIKVGDDLNTYLYQSEKKGGSRVRDPQSEKLIDLISEWDLQDIRPLKGKFTWNNRRGGLNHIAARLDRFFISNDFLFSAFDISSCIVPYAISDHKLISLHFSPPHNFGPFPFRFNPLWLDSPLVSNLVQQAWMPFICWMWSLIIFLIQMFVSAVLGPHSLTGGVGGISPRKLFPGGSRGGRR
jgi:hypothetical protein